MVPIMLPDDEYKDETDASTVAKYKAVFEKAYSNATFPVIALDSRILDQLFAGHRLAPMPNVFARDRYIALNVDTNFAGILVIPQVFALAANVGFPPVVKGVASGPKPPFTGQFGAAVQLPKSRHWRCGAAFTWVRRRQCG